MKSIIDSIYSEPEKWSINEYHFKHSNGLSIWIGNGRYGFHLESGGEFNWSQRRSVYKAYRSWLASAPISKLGFGHQG